MAHTEQFLLFVMEKPWQPAVTHRGRFLIASGFVPSRVSARVPQTVGNWTGLTGYRSGSVPVWSGMKPVQIQNLNLNSKKKIPKKFLKILQGVMKLMVSNFLKNLFI